jgi:hypothetical protein
MIFRPAIFSALIAFFLTPAKPAAAQISAYGELTGAQLTNLVGTSVLFGPTVGVTDTLVRRIHVEAGIDLRGSFLGASKRLDGVAGGPVLSFWVRGIRPYAEFLVGYAHSNGGLSTPYSGASSAQIELIGGVDKQLNRHLYWRVFEYSYEQYYALGGEFNPKNFSTGLVYRFRLP